MWRIFDLLKRFIGDLYHAVVFALIEHDQKLQETSTTEKRVLWWIMIVALFGVLFFGAVYGLWYLLDGVNVTGF